MKAHKDIDRINLDISDNNKYIVRWDYFIPAASNSECRWDDKEMVYDSEEAALEKVSELFREKLALMRKAKESGGSSMGNPLEVNKSY